MTQVRKVLGSFFKWGNNISLYILARIPYRTWSLDIMEFFCGGRASVDLTRRDESPELRAESQQIAAWQLLYRVQHPARYQSRLQTIPSPDIELPEG
jgi:hypothetical protein